VRFYRARFHAKARSLEVKTLVYFGPAVLAELSSTASGTVTPAPAEGYVFRVIERAAPQAVGLDIKELTPAYDRGETAFQAARLARVSVAAKAKGVSAAPSKEG